MIIKGVPESKPSPVMVKTVLSDEVSEISLLRDILISQREEQVKVTKVVLKQFENLGKVTRLKIRVPI